MDDAVRLVLAPRCPGIGNGLGDGEIVAHQNQPDDDSSLAGSNDGVGDVLGIQLLDRDVEPLLGPVDETDEFTDQHAPQAHPHGHCC